MDAWAKAKEPRRKNWNTPVARIRPGREIHTTNHGQYSRKFTFTRYSYTGVVGSICYLRSTGKYMIYRYAGEKFQKLFSPAGYIWAADNNGVKLVSKANTDVDYHVSSDDLRWYSKKNIRAILVKNASIRAEAKKAVHKTKKIIKKAEKEGLKICFRDAVKAGNCSEGISAFCERYNLQKNGYYAPSVLLRIPTEETKRVALAVAVGLKRHNEEMRRGFCYVADHKN